MQESQVANILLKRKRNWLYPGWASKNRFWRISQIVVSNDVDCGRFSLNWRYVGDMIMRNGIRRKNGRILQIMVRYKEILFLLAELNRVTKSRDGCVAANCHAGMGEIRSMRQILWSSVWCSRAVCFNGSIQNSKATFCCTCGKPSPPPIHVTICDNFWRYVRFVSQIDTRWGWIREHGVTVWGRVVMANAMEAGAGLQLAPPPPPSQP